MYYAQPSTDKAKLRATCRAMRLALTPGESARLSYFACAHVLRSEAWKKARRIALYVAIRNETDPSVLMQNALTAGKTVFLPVCPQGTEGAMHFCPCAGTDDLRPGRYGILEPVADISNLEHQHLDIIIVPGLAFTADGLRLGQGGGYYDRMLSAPEYCDALSIGLAYDFQILPCLPQEQWDKRMHGVATERGILWTK